MLNIDFKKMQSNNAFRIISGSIGFLFLIFIIYSIYSYFKNKSREQPYLIKYPRRGDLITEKDSSTGKTINSNSYLTYKNDALTPSNVRI